MSRRFISFCTGVCVLLFVAVAHAQVPQVATGLTYLASSQNADGTWSNDASTVDATAATVAALDSLKQLNESGISSYSAGISWLQGQSPQSVAYTADRIRTLALGTGSLDSLMNALDQLKGAWGGGEGYETDILDTAIVLQTLRSADYADVTVTSKALAYLTANQNPDGGWGFRQGDESNVYITAVVSAALQQFPQVTSIATAVNKASNYLLNHQNADGGFGSSESTPYETALAYSALVAVSSNTPALTSATNYLTATQAADGSWLQDAYSTALALKALYLSENKPSAPPPPPAGGTITGTVVDAVTKARVPGVAISLVNNSLINITSDSSGNFTLSDVPSGAQSVSFTLTGYAAKTASTDLVVGGVTNLGNVELLSSYSTGNIAGTITDLTGKPLADAAVTVSGAWSGSAVTGADGSYSFSYVLPGDVTITVTKAGFQTVTGTGTVFARTKLSYSPRLNNTMPQGTTGAIFGRIVDSYWGVPIGHLSGEKGVQVFVSGRAPLDVEPEGGGYFTIPGLAPNTYQLTVGMPGFASQTFRAVIMPGVSTDLGTIRLEMTVSEMALTGTITDAASGAPIPGAEVAIAGTDLAGRADFTGTYAMAGIKVAGELTVKISASGYTGKTIVMGPAPWMHTVNFSLTPQVTTGGLTGTVIDAITKEPLGGVNLSVAGDQAMATTGADGVFSFGSLQPGTSTVTLDLPGYSSRVLTTPITVGAVSDVGAIAISTGSLPATVQGRVWDSPANAPFAGVAVKVLGANALDTVSAPDGTYSVENIEPGKVTIATGIVPKAGYGSARFSAQVEPGGVLVFNPVLSTSVSATVDLSMQSDKGVYKVGESANVAIHVQNRQSVETPATLYLQVFDPSGAVVFESSNDVMVPADGQSDLPVSVALPAAGVPGTYRVVLSAYAPNGSLVRDAVINFGVAVTQVAITPTLPAAFSGGVNALSFALKNQGILPVSAGNLVVTLKDPDEQVVSSTATPFSLDTGQTVNLAPTVTFPALKLGDYTLAYVVNDETRNGVATELQIPNSFSIAGLYDDSSRRVRNTANLTVALGNTGKLNIPAGSLDAAAVVTVAVPDAGYSETKLLSALPAVGSAMSTAVVFGFIIPETISAGQHATKITLTLPSGSSFSQNAMLTITESSVSLASIQGTYPAGDVIRTAFANSGGVDTQVQYRMSLYDAKSTLVAEKTATEGIVAGSTVPLDIIVPAGAVDGSYNLVIAYADTKTGKQSVSQNPITVSGVKGTLQVQTGKENYLLTESITGTSAISNNGTPLDGGMLHLQVVTGPGSEKKKTWTTQADFQTGLRSGVDTYGVNDWIVPDDDFEGPALDVTKWRKVGNVNVQGGKLVVDSSTIRSSVYSNYLLDGDFDMQVDFSENRSTDNGVTFAISGGNSYLTLKNTAGSGYACDIVANGVQKSWNSTGAYTAAGRLRIARVADIIIGYFWNGFAWVEIGRGQSSELAKPVYVVMEIWSIGQNAAKYDNFKVNSGRIKTESQTVDSVRLLPLNDNFDDGILNLDRWAKSDGNPAVESAGSVLLTSNSSSTYRALQLRYQLPGDFASVAKYSNFGTVPSVTHNGEFLFRAGIGKSGFYVVRSSDFPSRAGGQFHVGLSHVANLYYMGYEQNYSSSSGYLRLRRAATTGYDEYWNGNNWNTLFSDSRMPLDPATITLSTVSDYEKPEVHVGIDSFYTNKGSYANNGTLVLRSDSGSAGTSWKKLLFSATQPMETALKFRTRTAETEEGLTTAPWSDYLTASGSPITSYPARWIEIEATLATTNANVTPLLNDLSVTYASAPGEVLWQTDVPANLAEGALANLDSTVGTLGVVGKLYLQGSLLSSTGQAVATAEYPFYIEQGNTQVVLAQDKKIYRPGEVVTITGETRNLSSVAATGLTLAVKGSDVTSLYSESFDVAANSARPFSFTTVAGSDGVYTLTGSVTQNSTIIADTVEQYAVANPALTASFDAPETAGEAPITVSVTVANPGKIGGTTSVRVVDDAGDVVGEQSLTLSPGETRVVQYSHQLYASATYSAILTGDLNQVLTKSVSFTTAAITGSVSSKIVADRVSYKPNEQVTLATTISSTYMREGLSAQVAIVSSQGQAVYTATSALPSLMQGQTVTVKTYWNCGATPAGTYRASVNIVDAAGQVVSTASCDVVIDSVTNPAALLNGKAALDKQSILTSEPVNVTYSLTNTGNADIALLSTWVRVINLDGTVLLSMADQTALALGATHEGTGQIETVGYDAKDYLVLVGATIDGTEEMLASTYFRVEGAPTAPSLEAPVRGADVEALPVTLSVGNAADPNADRLSYHFEIYSDSSLTTLVDSGTVSETAGSTGWTTSAPLIENATYFWRARAFDGILYGEWMTPGSFRVNMANDLPTAPTISSPMDGSAVATLTPELTVGNSTDPDSTGLTYNFQVARDPDFVQIVADGPGVSGGAASTSWTLPVMLQENVTYHWRAQADDWLIEGPWSATGSFFVNTANEAPSMPVVTSPANGSTVASLMTDAVVANSSDPDSTTISYYFEADTVPSFDSGNVLRSAGVTQGSGSTSWPLEGLSDNTRYYLRAKASDGTAESAWSATTTFFANTANDAPTSPVLANPSNGAGVKVFAPSLSVYNATDLDHDALSYEFELYADQALTNLVTWSELIAEAPQTTQWQVPLMLTENQTYYWRSRAFDGKLPGEWTAAASFMINTADDAPGAPKLFSPADGAGVETSSPVLAVSKALDPDSDSLTYEFELYQGGTLALASPSVTGDANGIISWTPAAPLTDNTVYQWRARAHDGGSYGPWMDMASFTVHIPKTSITATVDFDPNTLNRASNGTWVVVYIELPQGYSPADIDLASVRLEGMIPAELKPSCIGDHDKDGIADLMVKFRRSDVIAALGAGDKVPVHASGTVGPIMFDGVDVIRVIK